MIFFKATTRSSVRTTTCVIPRGGSKLDWEVELAVVIGARATTSTPAQALDHVAGYALHNDYSERAFQLERGGQWVKGKSADTFAPLGPFLATRDEIPDPGQLRHVADGQRHDAAAEHDRQHDLRRARRSSATSASS